MSSLSKKKIKYLLKALNNELEKHGTRGELYLVGGAVMCLVFGARDATKDVDGIFAPTNIVKQAAKKIAKDEDIEKNWLNDAVKGFLSDKGEFKSYEELSNLSIFVPLPEYLLAMKCLAFRIGAEFHDEEDVRYLLRYLNIETIKEALIVIEKYYPRERIPQKAFYALEEILTGKAN